MSTSDILERIRSVLDYDQATGVFRWRYDRKGVRGGTIAGGIAVHGYWRLHVDGKTWWAHRLAWFYVYGEVPTLEVDHIDGNRSNNAIANLRLATRRQNQINKKMTKAPKSGYRGVRKQDQKWRADIRIAGVRKYLGVFDTPELASAAYAKEAAKHHGEFAFSRQNRGQANGAH